MADKSAPKAGAFAGAALLEMVVSTNGGTSDTRRRDFCG
jgi:hypothetical protein